MDRKGIKFVQDENWKKILEADKILNINSLPTKEKLPPLSFGQYVVGGIFFIIFILMIIFGLIFLPVIFSGK